MPKKGSRRRAKSKQQAPPQPSSSSTAVAAVATESPAAKNSTAGLPLTNVRDRSPDGVEVKEGPTEDDAGDIGYDSSIPGDTVIDSEAITSDGTALTQTRQRPWLGEM